MKLHKIIFLTFLFVSIYTPLTTVQATTISATTVSMPSSALDAQTQTSTDWYMAGANPQMISGVSTVSIISDSGSVAKFDKQEITFNVATSASNPQLPFDTSAPAGINGADGVSVDGVLTSPSGKTWVQPGFYYQIFDDQVKGGGAWFYPTSQAVWKVRFSPDEVGTWQYYIKAQDKTGITKSGTQSFTVTPSTNHGFIKASKSDPRYFEYSDGTYFPALGMNSAWNEIGWTNPSANQDYFQKTGSNGIQVIRMWLSQWSIFGSSWNPWYPIRNTYDGYLPRAGLYTNGVFSTPMSPLRLVYADNNSDWFDACRFIGGFQAPPAVKQNTKYHIKIRYKAQGISGPRNSAYSGFGFVAKVQNPYDGNWHTNCYDGGDPQNGVKVTGYGKDSTDWTYLEGEWNSGTHDTLPMFYLALENANGLTATVNGQPWNKPPEVDIDTVFIGEDLGGVNYGPNIVTKPSMDQITYYMERNAYAFDKVLDLAKQNGVYLKLVVMEKNELLENEIGFDGNRVQFDNNNFYGNYRTMTAVRWYQQAWWRYLQARWGYSPNVFAFEAVNEAAPAYTNHYGQVDEMGKYLHCGVFGVSLPPTDGQKCNLGDPNAHMVSTSFWSGFESGLFVSNKYPNIDYADIHKYIPKDTDLTHFKDTALSTYDLGLAYGALESGSGKPIIRGETGLINQEANTDSLADVSADTQGIWLHNLIWGGINPSGLIENYWYAQAHIYNTVDLRYQFKNYYTFIKDIHLNNGKYVDAAAAVSNPKIRAWGQKDLTNQRAHLWIANTDHVWTNTGSIAPVSGTVTIAGLSANTPFNVEWWNTYTGVVTSTQVISTNPNGQLILTVSNLSTDIAVKIVSQMPYANSITPANPNPTSAASVDFTVIFSKPVTGVDLTDFALTTSGVTGASLSAVNGSGDTYTVTVNTGTSNGTIRLDVVDDDSIKDTANNPLGGVAAANGNFTSGEVYTVSKGTTFGDVPSSHPYFNDIEILYANGYTAGCSTTPLNFCPEVVMNRAQAAVFMMRGNFGSAYLPPSVPSYFFTDDWANATWAETWAEAMFTNHLTGGCSISPLLFCPYDQLTNAQTAVFGLRLKYGLSYAPPAASGTVFADMTDLSFWGLSWAEQAYADGLIPSCGTDAGSGKPMFCPDALVTRGFGASIIVKAKNLTMP